MTKYVVSASASDSRDIEVEASTPAEAIRKAIYRATFTPRPRAESVTEIRSGEKDEEGDSWDVVAFCESCRAPILSKGVDDATRYVCDEEGCYVCEKCLTEIEAEEAKQVAGLDEEACGGGFEAPCTFPKCKAWGCEPPEEVAGALVIGQKPVDQIQVLRKSDIEAAATPSRQLAEVVVKLTRSHEELVKVVEEQRREINALEDARDHQRREREKLADRVAALERRLNDRH